MYFIGNKRQGKKGSGEIIKEEEKTWNIWAFWKKRAQAILCSELIKCFGDVSKIEDGLYNSIYCPVSSIDVHLWCKFNQLLTLREKTQERNAGFRVSVCKILNNWIFDKYFHEFMQIHTL